MGGRGSSSSTYQQIKQYVFGKRTGRAKPIDITRFQNDSLQKTENRIRKLNREQLYVFDEKDHMLGGYQGDDKQVSFPAVLQQLKGVTVTHSHPKSFGDFGGTFSFPDVVNMIQSKWKEHRAVSSGQGEYNYIMRAKIGKNGQRMGNNKGLLERLRQDEPKIDNEFRRISRETFLEFAKQGKSPEQAAHVARQKSVGYINRYWKDTLPKYGYEYIAPKKEYDYNRPPR